MAGAALVVVAAGAGALTAARVGEALPGTSVAGRDVGGRDRTAVRATVDRLADARTDGALTVTAADVRATVPRELLEVDVAATVEQAMDDGGSPLGLLLRRGDEVALRTTVDRAGLAARVQELAGQVDRAPFAGGLVVRGVAAAAEPPTPGRVLDRPAATDAVADALEGGQSEPVAVPVEVVPTRSTPAQVEAVAAAARAALGATYVLSSGPLRLALAPQELGPLLRFASSDTGPVLSLDTPALRALVAAKAAPLARAADRRGPQPLPVTTVAPPVPTAEAAGVRTVVGTFTTYFAAGQPRATNIRRIAQIVDGTWVAPGEVFSLNGTAGARTRGRGFVADGAIVDGELTDEVGGGVSQFATTLFNAAFFAGLPILQHQPHSFYISRYPAGRESTVYYGSIDVRFRNDTAHGLLVRTRSTAGSVTVELYGDNGGRRVTSTSGPRRPRDDGGFRIDVTRTTTGGDGQGGRRVFSTSYDPVPPE